MLEIRPNCELCDRDLPPESGEAMICTYECTYCADCAKSVLADVCPKCGGKLEVPSGEFVSDSLILGERRGAERLRSGAIPY